MAARATISQAGSVVSSVNNNAITARLKRQLYKDVWPWTFARNSVDGALGINVPRLGANGGIRVMEGTTNLLPAGAENFVTGWTNNTGETCTVTDYPVNIPGVGDVIAKRIVGNGLGSIPGKYYASVSGRTNPHTETVSVWVKKMSGTAFLQQAPTAYSQTITETMQKITCTGLQNAVYTALVFATAAPTDILDIVVYAPQIENKPYATDYVAPGATRAAESLTVPATVIDPAQPFSIEFDAVPTNDDKSAEKYLFGLATNINNCLLVVSNATTGFYSIYHRLNTGTVRTITSSVAAVSGAKKSHKIDVSGAVLTYSLDGATIGTTTFDGLPSLVGLLMQLGNNFNGADPRNGYISNVRIRKGIALSAAERAYTGPLKADQFTTFFAPWSIT